MDISEILKSSECESSHTKTSHVSKALDLDIDLGNLLALDSSAINVSCLHSAKDGYLSELCRDNTQLLFNALWQLPMSRCEDSVVVKLPHPSSRLPREKPVPEKKGLTKWEQYARAKGINKRKKERMVWDEEKKEWRPRWGYKRVDADSEKWCLEVPQNADKFEDQFAKLKKEKTERVAKNELQRLRNIGRNLKKTSQPGLGVVPAPNPAKEAVGRALHEAQSADASLGKFSNSGKEESAPVRGHGKKRKFQDNHGDLAGEKRRALDILGKMNAAQAPVDKAKLGGRELARQDQEKHSSNQSKAGHKNGATTSQGKRAKQFSAKKAGSGGKYGAGKPSSGLDKKSGRGGKSARGSRGSTTGGASRGTGRGGKTTGGRGGKR